MARKRTERQNAVRRIIRAEQVRTQFGLVERLKGQGFVCTQATISRDITAMGVRKLPDGVYVLAEDLHLQRMVSDLVVSVVQAGNLVIVKASAGTAPGVAAALDAAQFDEIVGSIAGDDTILVITPTEGDADKFVDTLERFRKPAPRRARRTRPTSV